MRTTRIVSAAVLVLAFVAIGCGSDEVDSAKVEDSVAEESGADEASCHSPGSEDAPAGTIPDGTTLECTAGGSEYRATVSGGEVSVEKAAVIEDAPGYGLSK